MFGNLRPASRESRFFAHFSEGSAPSQGPVAYGYVSGCLGRSSLKHQPREFEVQQKNLERISLERFRSPNRPLGHKIQIPHCPIAMRYLFFTLFLRHQINKLIGGGQIRPGVLSRKQNHGSTVRGFPIGENGKLLGSCSAENSKEPELTTYPICSKSFKSPTRPELNKNPARDTFCAFISHCWMETQLQLHKKT
jgi:hypothetical protein